MSHDWHPNIFEYLDFREYLRAFYDAGKANTNVVSFRYLSRRAGFTSPNYYKLVMDGDRGLTSQSTQQFADALGLGEEERQFFVDLVAFDQADTDEERNQVFERIAGSRRFRSARRLDSSLFEYLSRWWHPVIREMVARPDFREDPKWIARQLLPRIDESEVAHSIELLLELGLLERDEDGDLVRGAPTLTTGHEVRSLALGNFHRQMLQRSAESIETVESELRHISAITAAIDHRNVDALKERINAFRESLIDLFERQEAPDTIYQFNVQFFPLNDPNPAKPGEST